MDSDKSICYAVYTGKGGYPGDRERADKVFIVGQRYDIIGGEVGSYHTTLRFAGISGAWNSTLFEFNREEAPLTNTYGSLTTQYEIWLKNRNN